MSAGISGPAQLLPGTQLRHWELRRNSMTYNQQIHYGAGVTSDSWLEEVIYEQDIDNCIERNFTGLHMCCKCQWFPNVMARTPQILSMVWDMSSPLLPLPLRTFHIFHYYSLTLLFLPFTFWLQQLAFAFFLLRMLLPSNIPHLVPT